MKKKTIISVLLIIVMMLNIVPITVYADSRTEISYVNVTTDMVAPTYGAEVRGDHSYNSYTYNTNGSPATVTTTMGGWLKEVDGEWKDYNGSSFIEGKYYFYNQIRLDGTAGVNYKFSNSLQVRVDGVLWNVSGVENYESYCMAYISSPVYSIDYESIPLTFNYNPSFEIAENYCNVPIHSYSVADGAIGGTGNYTFSKISGPSWINVSSDGIVSGTPVAIGNNSNLVIRVTDQASNYKEITISVGKTFENPADRTPIYRADVISTMWKPAYGMSVQYSYNYTYEEVCPIRFTNTMSIWYKYNGSEWEEYTEATFGTGRYYYSDQIRIDGAAGREYVFGNPFKLIVNGEEWGVHSVQTYDTFSFVNVDSPVYEIQDTTPAYKLTVLTDNPINKVEYNGVKYPSGQTFYFKQGDKIILYAKAGEGYEFDEAESSDVTLSWGGSICRYFTMPSSSVTVTFNFNEIKDTYEVNFETGAGSSVSQQLVDRGSYATKPQDPTRSDNWTFYGWLENLSDVWNTFDFTNTPINKDTTLYARWGFYAYISTDTTKGRVTSTSSLADPPTFSEGSGFNGIIYEGRPWYVYAQAKEGYVFKHWKNTTTNEVYSTENPVCFDEPLGVNSRILAVYDVDPNAVYTVSFDTKGGSSIDSQHINKGSFATRPSVNPTREGYVFEDWYEDNACTTKFDFSNTPIEATTTIYANWTPTTATAYTIKFDSRGGSTVPDQTVYEGNYVIKPSIPSKGNWVVIEWLTNPADSNSIFNFNTTIPNKNMTLYARWGSYFYFYNDTTKGKISLSGSLSEEPADYGEGSGFNGYIYENEPWFVWAKPNDGYQFEYWMNESNGEVISRNRALQVNEPLVLGVTRIKAVYEKKLPFTDVSRDAWYYNAVRFVYENNIVKGYNDTTFAPEDKLTRGMMVTLLYRMEGSPNNDGKSRFTDVNPSEWYAKAIKWAVDNGIVHGYDGTTKFGPNDNIIRQDLAGILRNYAKYKGKDVNVTADLTKFSDYKKVDSYAKPAVQWAVGKGVITGNDDGTLNPKGNATRAEASAMIQKYCNKVGY